MLGTYVRSLKSWSKPIRTKVWSVPTKRRLRVVRYVVLSCFSVEQITDMWVWQIDSQVKQATQAVNKLQSDAQESLRKMQASEDI